MNKLAFAYLVFLCLIMPIMGEFLGKELQARITGYQVGIWLIRISYMVMYLALLPYCYHIGNDREKLYKKICQLEQRLERCRKTKEELLKENRKLKQELQGSDKNGYK